MLLSQPAPAHTWDSLSLQRSYWCSAKQNSGPAPLSLSPVSGASTSPWTNYHLLALPHSHTVCKHQVKSREENNSYFVNITVNFTLQSSDWHREWLGQSEMLEIFSRWLQLWRQLQHSDNSSPALGLHITHFPSTAAPPKGENTTTYYQNVFCIVL